MIESDGLPSEKVDDLFAVFYEELRRIAHSQRRARGAIDTLSTTVVVHEAYLKVAGRSEMRFKDRAHFFAAAAKVMRHVVATYAERRNTQKRGGGTRPMSFDELLFIDVDRTEEAIVIHRAIETLEAEQPRIGRVLECRIFGGMTVEETAAVLSISQATVKRDWRAGTIWLYQTLGIAPPGSRPLGDGAP